MTKDELIYKVKAKLEELSPFDDTSYLHTDNIVKPITSYIDDALESSCNDALLIIPLHLIRPKDFHDTQLVQTSRETGYVILPKDFLRLYSFKMCSWFKDVTKPISVGNPAYALQKNPYTMGKAHSPVCVLNDNKEFIHDTAINLTKTLEYYSVNRYIQHNIDRALYVAKFNASEIQEDLAEFYSLSCAISVLDILGQEIEKELLTKELAEMLASQTY